MTHKEEIDVPDGWMIDKLGAFFPAPGERGCIAVHVRPLPPPEPPIMPCAYCGAEWAIRPVMTAASDTLHKVEATHDKNCLLAGPWFPTRLAAIQAANRRAT